MLEWFHNFEPSPILIAIGYWQIHWYGFLFGLAALVAYWLVSSDKNIKLTKLDLPSLYFELLIIGLIGARIFDVIVYEWWYFKDHLWDILKIWQGGLAWQGGLLFGATYLYGYCRTQKISMINLVDWLVPGLALGQAIGRLGNYFNQELFGWPTSLPWGIKISPVNRPVEFANFEYFHPVFLYELLFLVAVVLILKFLNKKNIPGLATAWYLIATGAARFILELIRTDPQNLFFGIRIGLLLAAVMIVGGMIYRFFTCRIKFIKEA